LEKNNIIGNNIYCESFFITKGIVKIINMGYKTKSMLHQSSGKNIKFLRKRKARRMRDSDVFVETEDVAYKNEKGEDKIYQKIVGFKDKNPYIQPGDKKDEGMSSHFMRDDGDKLAWPSIYKTDSGEWVEQSKEEAKERGELFEFKSTKRMQKFAEGSWKNKKFIKGKFFK